MKTPAKTKTIKHLSNPRPVRRVSVVVILFLIGIWLMPAPKAANSAGISTVVVGLGEEAPSAETLVTVTFTPITTLASKTIKIYLGNNTTVGNEFTDGGTTLSAADMNCTQTGGGAITGSAYAAATTTVPMLFTGTVDGSGNTNEVVCVLGDNETNDAPHLPATAGSYSIAVVTTDDSGAGIAYVGNANDVTVSATVLPNLSLTIDGADGTTCTTTGGGITSCDLGVVTTAAVNTGYYNLNVGTNADGGAALKIAEDGDLRNIAESATITDIVEDAGGTVTEGVTEYGIQVDADVGSWTEAGNFTDNDTPIPTGPATVATTAGPIATTGDDVTITHRVAVDSTVKALVYTHTVTWTATATF